MNPDITVAELAERVERLQKNNEDLNGDVRDMQAQINELRRALAAVVSQFAK